MTESYAQNAKIMKAFCDENRLRVLEMLASGEKCACMLLRHLDIGQPSLSYHMKILVESGVVEARQDGKWTHYSLSETGCAKAAEILRQATTACGETAEDACCAK